MTNWILATKAFLKEKGLKGKWKVIKKKDNVVPFKS